MTTVSAELAREAAEMSFEALPSPAVHEVKRRLIDTLGCAIGGYASEEGQIIAGVVRELGCPPEATVVGGLRTSAIYATLANGVMLRYTEGVDIGFRTPLGVPGCGHPCEVIPSILAVGERQHSTGKEVIAAIVLGYQLITRLGSLVGHGTPADLMKFGWRNDLGTSYIVPLVVGKLLDLDEAQMAHAVGISGAFAGQLRILDMEGEEVTMSRDLAYPFPAAQGILSALMAQKGFTGPSRVFEGPGGFAESFTRGNIDLAKLTQRDRDFAIVYTGTKSHPADGRMLGPLQAALSLVEEHDIRPEQVAEVSVTGHRRLLDHTGDSTRRRPKTKQEAASSIYHTIAVAIIDRASRLDQFAGERLQDPNVWKLSDKIVVNRDARAVAELEGLQQPGIVEITMIDGTRYTRRVDVPRGNPANPMSDAEIEEKFRSMATAVMDQSEIRRTISVIYDLEKLDDIGELAKTLTFRTS